MGPLIPFVVAGKVITIPVVLAIKKYGFTTVGKKFLQSAVGFSALAALGYLGHKGLEFTGVYDEMKKNRCPLCTKSISKEKILSSPMEVKYGERVFIVECCQGNCPAKIIFKEKDLKST